LRRGLAGITREDPDRAARILERAVAAIGALRDEYPGDPGTGRLTGDEAALDRFFARHVAMPCPALDPDTRRCEMYDARPVACRTYGPPLKFGAEEAPHCRLCFDGAPPETVERCRMEPDREGVENALLARVDVTPGEDWETLVAFAIKKTGD